MSTTAIVRAITKKTGTVYQTPGLSFGVVRVANLFNSYDKIISTFFFYLMHMIFQWKTIQYHL